MTRGRIPFLKAHGAGNDFLVLDEQDGPIPEDLTRFAPQLCCRRTGVGGDGILVIRRPSIIPVMECWNADGSRAEACGNGLRVLSLILSDGLDGEISIETDSGLVRVQQSRDSDGQFLAEAALGMAQLEPTLQFSAGGITVEAIPVKMGNPHLVVSIDPEDSSDPVHRLGPTLEHAIPSRANVGFVRVDSPSQLVLRVWERGCGETLACGTGAAAAFAALQQCEALDDVVSVQMPGGKLQVRKDSQGCILVSGPAKISFRGELSLPELQQIHTMLS
ncbi:MAG: diaminopimelate epimerase [Planctomycetota bacterium]